MSGARRDFDAGHDLDRAVPSRRDVAQGERAADVVVVGERDHVETRALRRVEDLLERGEAVSEIAMKL